MKTLRFSEDNVNMIKSTNCISFLAYGEARRSEDISNKT